MEILPTAKKKRPTLCREQFADCVQLYVSSNFKVEILFLPGFNCDLVKCEISAVSFEPDDDIRDLYGEGYNADAYQAFEQAAKAFEWHREEYLIRHPELRDTVPELILL